MTVVHLFHADLRTDDNLALNEALARATTTGEAFLPLYLLNAFDTECVELPEQSKRAKFLSESLSDLTATLEGKGLPPVTLMKADPSPLGALLKLVKALEEAGQPLSLLTYQRSTVPSENATFREIRKELEAYKKGVTVKEAEGRTLYPVLPEVMSSGNLSITYQGFLAQIRGIKVSLGVDFPDELPTARVPMKALDNLSLSIDSLVVDGLQTGSLPGGETEGKKRLRQHLARSAWIRGFEKPKTAPNTVKDASTTQLSPYLAWGCISPRRFYEGLREAYSKGPHSDPPTSLMGQLYWREFYYLIGQAVPHYDQMKGNWLCQQMPWRTDAAAEADLQRWKEGRTGFPFIDACMRQLATEGWIHHLARHAVACFLTRGDLWCHWEAGRDHFRDHLLDGDWALNAGNWMWLSASAFFNQYYRVYSPIAFGKKTDPEGEFIKKWCPELKHYPKKFIYQPWEASAADQKQWKCIIGSDYPPPMCDHNIAKDENIQKLKSNWNKKKPARMGPPEIARRFRELGPVCDVTYASASKPQRKEPDAKKRKLA